ncbi:Signal transduction histidine kinase [Butyrivibrio fibrisolvens DSM 3071]|uniref:Circadian input-output histidine kinase CikA n=1 Tax=Butyrivibrio fibrisolvens DSM 3071 TaxID=1121131 RepID=A0A1M5QC79_BUTFI|nr:response regulator [Butyrivibrio fibrisolvens]SHH11794.1 Signal transduction histidine kinase [Butyrivibrio fibrisolvens DSM 3071]
MLSFFTKKNKLVASSLSVIALIASLCAITLIADCFSISAYGSNVEMSQDAEDAALIGGGFAVTGQSSSLGYSAVIYDEKNGLLTSEANYILGSSDGYIWIGSYSGIYRYDGIVFDRIDYSEGLTSGRGLFEDSKGRIWIGTNDNGVVMIEGERATWITYKEGLPSSSIRHFAEDLEGNIYIGTTAGVCYADTDLNIHIIGEELFGNERVLKLDSDSAGTVYGSTKDGTVFSIKNKNIDKVYKAGDLCDRTITTILADPAQDGYVYLCTNDGTIYHGEFGKKAKEMKLISTTPIKSIHWISYDCDRIWISSTSQLGYIDESERFHLVENLPMDSGIEMSTSDFQGNIWLASSTMGIMKIISCNFQDLSVSTQMPQQTTNATCLLDGNLYAGTDSGLYILDPDGRLVINNLTDYLDGTRIRCISADSKDNLWISTYSNGLGLVCCSKDGAIKSYTMEEGLPSNEIRCAKEISDGSIAAGTNGGLVIIKDGLVQRVVGADDGIKNTIFLTVEEGDNGEILVGTDGDGLYVITDESVRRLGREDGLTSEVVQRIKKDDKEDLYWVILSNGIGYLKRGEFSIVSTFPNNNNYDMYSDSNNNIWILSSFGVYTISRDKMIGDAIDDYRLFDLSNGLPCKPTSNSYSAVDDDGNLYFAGRQGVCKVNIDHFFEEKMMVKAAVKSVYCGDERILIDEQGRYVLPATDARIKISVAVLDYTVVDPQVHIYMDGNLEDAIQVSKSKLTPLEYTRMKHGTYTLHIQVLAGSNTSAMVDQSYIIIKQPKFFELMIFRVMGIILTAIFTGIIVWRVMKGTVIRKQYEEISRARDEAQRANTAKTRFLANISHEVRTPINTILGMNEMIMREDATGVPKGYFMSMMNYAFDIKNAADTLLGLINDLLDMSKIESGKMHLVEQEYDVAELIRSVVSMIRVKSNEKELTFDVVIDEIMPTKLYGDAGKIKQIVLNLLTNAVKYTKHGGFILIVSLNEREDDNADISFVVKDTGMGIKQEDMDKLFTAYERLEEQKNSSIQGTGLGLDISRKFAQIMGGSLTCESVYGEGSEFTLNIRQKIVDDTPIGLFVEHSEDTAKGPYVPKFIAPDADVLVVDDNPMNLSVMKGLLKATKIFVTTAGSGEECLEKMKTTKFNIVFLDHMMPGMDGIETIGRIRQNDPDIPVYALTANASVGEEFYKSKGFTGYLAKPVDSKALESAIMEHLPKEIMLTPEAEDEVEELTSMPEEFSWLYDIPEITVEEGIKNSGGISSYIFSLKLFLETIDGNAKVIGDAYDAGDLRLYTIKVHALKSSARIIGALGFSKICADLEEAGNKQDKQFIDLINADMLTEYLSFKDKLSRLESSQNAAQDKDKKEIDPSELEDAYSALKDVIPQMDYDSVELILNNLKEYKLPEKDSEIIGKLGKMLKAFDWDGMETIIGERS